MRKRIVKSLEKRLAYLDDTIFKLGAVSAMVLLLITIITG